MLDMRIDSARLLLPDGEATGPSLGIQDGKIRLDCENVPAHHVIDGSGLIVAPGIIDLHGDAFERQIMPRPGVSFPIDMALLETDRQLIANGITTAFHGITYTWEPGLRGRENCLALLEACHGLRDSLVCDTRLHLRWEVFHLDGLADVESWLNEGRIDLLAFNDHQADILASLQGAKRSKYVERTGLAPDALVSLAERVAGRHGEVDAAVQALAGIARRRGIPMLSHDDPDVATRQRYRDLGCLIAEFPKTRDTARNARDAMEAVVFGAPNVVRGGSHTNAVRAADMIADGLCDVLASDYYYPSQAAAAFRLEADGVLALAEAWKLISQNVAYATGLDDRGRLEEGLRADLVLLENDAQVPMPIATIIDDTWSGRAFAERQM
jgi:alpha-D-ribose 1-methylphosphonate 5-triphosphate diphosphatase